MTFILDDHLGPGHPLNSRVMKTPLDTIRVRDEFHENGVLPIHFPHTKLDHVDTANSLRTLFSIKIIHTGTDMSRCGDPYFFVRFISNSRRISEYVRLDL